MASHQVRKVNLEVDLGTDAEVRWNGHAGTSAGDLRRLLGRQGDKD